ncbi:hypothetical protein RRG08_007823 [Elysia crispata]|uniref:Uncharacterized protein n=1 Tax=Elysia crispata TaxID=231223 RepID=A0AAE1AFU1_9GAST|nr:hypothetical protein RRG08_007823 [Elysia crispata]
MNNQDHIRHLHLLEILTSIELGKRKSAKEQAEHEPLFCDFLTHESAGRTGQEEKLLVIIPSGVRKSSGHVYKRGNRVRLKPSLRMMSQKSL